MPAPNPGAIRPRGVTSFLVTGSNGAVLFDSGLGVAAIRDVVRRTATRAHAARWRNRDYAKATLDEDRVCGPLPSGVTSRAYRIPRWRISAQLRDGEVLEGSAQNQHRKAGAFSGSITSLF
jgi:hypothetical protein